MIIGAKKIARQDKKYHNIDDVEQVYGSQLPHRLVAKTLMGYRLMTPTKARKNGYQITDKRQVDPFNKAL